MKMNKEYIDVAVVPYALADTLLALYNCNVKEIVITKEDNDIHIRIDKQKVEKSVYGIIDELPTVSNTNGGVNND